MNFYQALTEIMGGNKITCPLWKKDGAYLSRNREGELEFIWGRRRIPIVISSLRSYLCAINFEILEE